MESDALSGVRYIAQTQDLSSVHGERRGYIQSSLLPKHFFDSCSFIWGPRILNKAAHFLCNWAAKVGWDEPVPDPCIPFILYKTLRTLLAFLASVLFVLPFLGSF